MSSFSKQNKHTTHVGTQSLCQTSIHQLSSSKVDAEILKKYCENVVKLCLFLFRAGHKVGWHGVYHTPCHHFPLHHSPRPSFVLSPHPPQSRSLYPVSIGNSVSVAIISVITTTIPTTGSISFSVSFPVSASLSETSGKCGNLRDIKC